MSRILSMILSIIICLSLCIPAFAVDEKATISTTPMDRESDSYVINGVTIPRDTKSEDVNNAIIYYDFYDLAQKLNYSFYNTATGEYFAISDPYEEIFITRESATKKIVHNFRLSLRYEGYSYSFPIAGTPIVNIEGYSSIVKHTTTDTDVTDEYTDHRYTLSLRRKGLFGSGGGSWSLIAGNRINQRSIPCDSGDYDVEVVNIDRLGDNDYLECYGQVYYYEL